MFLILLSYPNYTFVTDNDVSKIANGRSRYTDASLRGIILDIYLLSRCDYLVCTLSSNVGVLLTFFSTMWFVTCYF